MSDGIKKGTTIYTGKPFAFVVKSEHRTTRCDNCLKSEKLLRCTGCQYVYYCDRNCQKKSWPIHKAECVHLKKILSQGLLIKNIDEIRLVARIIIKLNQGGADEIDYYNEKKLKFKDLMSHYSDIKADTKRQLHFSLLYGMLFQFLDKTLVPDFEEVMGIWGRMCTNYFSITNDLDSIGIGIYLGASKVDHSCKPNATFVFEGTTIIIRTIMDLPSLDLSQIRIAYIGLLHSKKKRRELLHNMHYFWCDCERCKNEEPMAKAAACPNSSCDSPCSIEADECEKCSTKISIEFKETFQRISDFTANHLKELDRFDNEKIIFLSKTYLKMQKGVMHKFNVQHIQTLFTIHITSLNLEWFKDAELYAKKLLPGLLLYYGEVCPLIGLLYFTIGKLELLNNKPKEALQTLSKADTLLRITHGDKHSLVKEKLMFLIFIAMKVVHNM
ncbi:histone-lysine N-methyltransferase SMYD3 [Monomorium pharaonis]|uniref:histone-lysine N-methyltransferase SMYD3 n=1 Tax=Monomorium pharaonis TaxID=307658 RepID=UPI00063F1DE2|nr:histone-lysine N-methyltransferase SMYD3 [Monomorium pharaonis]XP_036147931.1 histone-lysine N-methyltransferase SMYD3 [Monomorium pharaonis]